MDSVKICGGFGGAGAVTCATFEGAVIAPFEAIGIANCRLEFADVGICCIEPVTTFEDV